MAWVAEILRKTHRECVVCRLAPIHVYDPPAEQIEAVEVPSEPGGTPLCHAHLHERLAADLKAFQGRCLIFEPSLGPESFLFRELDAGAEAGLALAKLPRPCEACVDPDGRFLWIPVSNDADLWASDWLPALTSGELAPADALCGSCAADRIARTLEDRGLHYEAIVPARGSADGMMCGWEIAGAE